MPQLELMTLVLYDITHDSTRTRVSESCLDFGLLRFQYSAFQGRLTRNRREELALVLERHISVHGGSIALFPLCHSDWENRIHLFVEPPPLKRRLSLYHGDEPDAAAPADSC